MLLGLDVVPAFAFKVYKAGSSLGCVGISNCIVVKVT